MQRDDEELTTAGEDARTGTCRLGITQTGEKGTEHFSLPEAVLEAHATEVERERQNAKIMESLSSIVFPRHIGYAERDCPLFILFIIPFSFLRMLMGHQRRLELYPRSFLPCGIKVPYGYFFRRYCIVRPSGEIALVVSFEQES